MSKLSPRAGGAVGDAVCVVFIALNVRSIRTEGKYYPKALAIGLGALPLCLAFCVLPTRMLLVPKESPGKVEYSTDNSKFTTLGGLLLIASIFIAMATLLYMEGVF